MSSLDLLEIDLKSSWNNPETELKFPFIYNYPLSSLAKLFIYNLALKQEVSNYHLADLF